MKKTFVERKFTLTHNIASSIEKKLERLDKFFSDDTEMVITLSSEGAMEKVELTIFENGLFYRSEEIDEKILCALDRAIDIIERQLRKNKTKLQRRIKKELPAKTYFDDIDYEEEEEFKISKVKRFPIKPMTHDEAILQMNMLGHQFFVFKDVETDSTCVVYRRHGNTYGIIVPSDE